MKKGKFILGALAIGGIFTISSCGNEKVSYVPTSYTIEEKPLAILIIQM